MAGLLNLFLVCLDIVACLLLRLGAAEAEVGSGNQGSKSEDEQFGGRLPQIEAYIAHFVQEPENFLAHETSNVNRF